MSATQKVQQHPAFQQAQDKASYYVGQLDKEVCNRIRQRLPWHAATSCPLTRPSLQLTKYPLLINFEQRTQVPKTYAFLGALVVLIFLHAVNAFASPISNLLGWALPAYLSVKALETPGHNDDIQWLTYWVVFGFFNFTESFALRAVLYYFPWYFAFKTLFILYLQLPAFRVSNFCFSGIYQIWRDVLT